MGKKNGRWAYKPQQNWGGRNYNKDHEEQGSRRGVGYFHPGMLVDPWVELRWEMGWMEEVHMHTHGDQEVRREYAHAQEEKEEDKNNADNRSGFGCARCTRHHPGLPGDCRSLDRACRRCGVVGHFQEVHDVTDEAFREIIAKTIKLKLWTK